MPGNKPLLKRRGPKPVIGFGHPLASRCHATHRQNPARSNQIDPYRLGSITKYLSINRHVHEDVSTGKLNESQPIVCFFAPAHPDAAALCQPTEGTFNDP